MKKLLLIGVVAILLCFSSIAGAVDTYWYGSTGDWFSPLNWMITMPTSADHAYIENGGTVTITNGTAEAYGVGVGAHEGTSGNLLQSGGVASFGNVFVGNYSGTGFGYYRLSGSGQLNNLGVINIGLNGIFDLVGGVHTVGKIELGGTYNLNNGQLSTSEIVNIGWNSTSATFNQFNGIHNSNNIKLASYSTYNLSGGELFTTNDQEVSGNPGAIIQQTGGTNTVDGRLMLGSAGGAAAKYNISGGALIVSNFDVGFFNNGVFLNGNFQIDNPLADISITNSLFFGAEGSITAISGSTINMDGASLDNWSKNEYNFWDLNNVNMIFNGGTGISTLEVAGQDIGSEWNGTGLFAFDTLTIGDTSTANVQLVNYRTNMGGTEALYVNNCIFGSGSTLDLNGINLYCNNIIDNGITINLNGGQLIQLTADIFYVLIPDTGQTVSYTSVWGEDSDYTINPPSYTDNEDGTVTDNVTGLMWQQEDDNNTYNWYEASGRYHATYNPGITDICGSSTLAGYSDWRLPDEFELMGIVNYGNYGPAIDTAYFPNTNSSDYWSGTEYVQNSTVAWLMRFYYGHSEAIYKSLFHYVRCVRGGEGTAHSFTANGDGKVTDNVTGLIWQQEDDNTERTWEEALTYCESLLLSGYSDWRLPNIKEIGSIVDHAQWNPAIDSTVFPNTKSGYWSSSPGASNWSGAWGVALYGGVVQYYSFSLYHHVKCVRGGTPEITNPLPGSTLSGSTETFTWTANEMPVTEWWLWVGTDVGKADIMHSGALGSLTSAEISGLPTNGSDVYLRLWYMSDRAWQYADFQYTACTSCGIIEPAIVTPVPEAKLTGSTVTFNWRTNGTVVSEWWLWVGTCSDSSWGGCGDDYYNSGSLTGETGSVPVSGLPTDGSSIFARLWYTTGTEWQSVWYEYTSGIGTPTIVNPVMSKTLASTEETVMWKANGTNVSAWELEVGSSIGLNDIHDSGPLPSSATSHAVGGLPKDGSIVYVRLWYETAGVWEYVDYYFTACTSCGLTEPEITSPVPDSTLTGATETFTWITNGTAVSAWYLWAGSCSSAEYGGCGEDYYNSGWMDNGTLTNTASNLPTDGGTVYMRLWYEETESGNYQSVLFQYTAFTEVGGGTPKIISPAPESILSGSTETFTWSANGTSVSAWWLWVGTAAGGQDILNSGNLDSNTSLTVNNLPTDGSMVYVRLHYNSGGWQSVDFQYTAANSGGTPEITSPAPDSTLSGSTETFCWTDNGTPVSAWWLWVGSSLGGQEIFNSGNLGSSTCKTVNKLPTDGSTVYVRLWYNAGSWLSMDYQYTANSGCIGTCAPEITTPVPGSTLTGETETFIWTAHATSVSEWWLWVGSSLGAQDILNSGSLGSSTSHTVSGLPNGGTAVYVRLHYKIGGVWQSSDFQYTAITVTSNIPDTGDTQLFL